MDKIDLTPVYIARFKMACDVAVQSLPGGAADACAAIGLSRSMLSRALNLDEPRVMLSIPAAMKLEHASKLPILASLFADLTYHHVVADDVGPDNGGRNADMTEVAADMSRENSEAVVSVLNAHRKSSPATARAALKELGESVLVQQRAMRFLAPIAAKAGG